MQDASPSPTNSGLPGQKKSNSSILIAGTLVLLIAGGIGLQMWRAKDSKAGQLPETTTQATPDLDALSQPVSRVNGVSISYATLAKVKEFYDAGVLMRLRYQTIPAERQRVSSEVVQAILRLFKQHYPAVKFGYPHSVVRYQADDPAGPPALRGKSGPVGGHT